MHGVQTMDTLYNGTEIRLASLCVSVYVDILKFIMCMLCLLV